MVIFRLSENVTKLTKNEIYKDNYLTMQITLHNYILSKIYTYLGTFQPLKTYLNRLEIESRYVFMKNSSFRAINFCSKKQYFKSTRNLNAFNASR